MKTRVKYLGLFSVKYLILFLLCLILFYVSFFFNLNCLVHETVKYLWANCHTAVEITVASSLFFKRKALSLVLEYSETYSFLCSLAVVIAGTGCGENEESFLFKVYVLRNIFVHCYYPHST